MATSLLRAMRTLTIVVAVASMAASGQSASEPGSGQLTPDERSMLVSNLETSKKEFLSSIKGLTPAQWTYKPGPDRWSVAECAEHIILAEDALFADAQRMLATPAVARLSTSDAAHDRELVAEVLDRSVKAKAPAAITPKGQFATPEEAAAEFTKRRDRTIAYAKSTQDALRAHVGDGPAGGTDDAYQVLLILAAHSSRHTMQIREVQGSAGYQGAGGAKVSGNSIQPSPDHIFIVATVVEGVYLA